MKFQPAFLEHIPCNCWAGDWETKLHKTETGFQGIVVWQENKKSKSYDTPCSSPLGDVYKVRWQLRVRRIPAGLF